MRIFSSANCSTRACWSFVASARMPFAPESVITAASAASDCLLEEDLCRDNHGARRLESVSETADGETPAPAASTALIAARSFWPKSSTEPASVKEVTTVAAGALQTNAVDPLRRAPSKTSRLTSSRRRGRPRLPPKASPRSPSWARISAKERHVGNVFVGSGVPSSEQSEVVYEVAIITVSPSQVNVTEPCSGTSPTPPMAPEKEDPAAHSPVGMVS